MNDSESESDASDREEIEQLVRDCLSHLYDFLYLQDHPLVRQLVPDATGPNRVQIFRDLITGLIESLQPGPEVAVYSRAARAYNILMLRYVNQQSTQDILHQLALSERQFYREHPRAIQLLSQMLRSLMAGDHVPEITVLPEDTISIQSEVRWAHSHDKPDSAPVPLDVLVRGALSAVRGLVEQHQAAVEIVDCLELSSPEVDHVVLRQAIIWVISELIGSASTGARLRVSCQAHLADCQIVFFLQNPLLDAAALQHRFDLQETLQEILTLLRGRLVCDQTAAGSIQVLLSTAAQQYTVLVIEDNPGMVDLFRRYLTNQPYQVVSAALGEMGIQIARQSKPDAIILDVMLPGEDGWEVLQNLKNYPATQQIPVLVCSVLDIPTLALSLGANEYIKKPPGQDEFLKALFRWTG